jgi:hypothetical protein
MGRVLGRALAHEIGHYLLRSPDHSVTGLMRAQHSIAELMAEDRGGFEAPSPGRAPQAARGDAPGASGSCQ